MNNCLLMIFAPPALEETLVDWLLENDAVGGFSTMHGFGHGSRPSSMSLLEQVAGRQRRVEFMIATNDEMANRLVGDLRQRFSGSGLHYMVTPLIAGGEL